MSSALRRSDRTNYACLPSSLASAERMAIWKLSKQQTRGQGIEFQLQATGSLQQNRAFKSLRPLALWRLTGRCEGSLGLRGELPGDSGPDFF